MRPIATAVDRSDTLTFEMTRVLSRVRAGLALTLGAPTEHQRIDIDMTAQCSLIALQSEIAFADHLAVCRQL